MDPIVYLVRTVARLTWRDKRSLFSFATGNFFVVSALLGRAGMFLLAVVCIALIVPFTSNPLHNLPAERIHLWPICRRDMLILQVIGPWLNPIIWPVIAIGLFLTQEKLIVLLTIIITVPLLSYIGALAPTLSDCRLWRASPSLPGSLGTLIKKDLREMMYILDLWVAIMLSLACALYRVFGHNVSNDALMVFSILVVLALSSWAQTCFGMDGSGGLLRYRLTPLPGWSIFAAKGIAFLIIITLLALPLSLPTAWAAALVALAVGNRASLRLRPQQRWTFCSSPNALNSLHQIMFLIAAGVATARVSALILIPSFLLFVSSSFWFGRKLVE